MEDGTRVQHPSSGETVLQPHAPRDQDQPGHVRGSPQAGSQDHYRRGWAVHLDSTERQVVC